MQKDRNEFYQQSPAGAPAGALMPVAQHDLTSPLLLSADDASDVQLPLSHYVWLVRTHWVKMLAFVAFAVFATAMVTARLTPQYEAKASLYLDRNAAKNLVGQDSQTGTANKGDTDNYIESQRQIVLSDAVLRPVVDQFKLQAALEDPTEDRLLAAKRNDAPIVLKGLTVTRPLNTFMLWVTYRSPDPVRSAEVANAVANSYVNRIFELRRSGSEDTHEVHSGRTGQLEGQDDGLRREGGPTREGTRRHQSRPEDESGFSPIGPADHTVHHRSNGSD